MKRNIDRNAGAVVVEREFSRFPPAKSSGCSLTQPHLIRECYEERLKLVVGHISIFAETGAACLDLRGSLPSIRPGLFPTTPEFHPHDDAASI